MVMYHICKFQNRVTIPKNAVNIELSKSNGDHRKFDFSLDLNKISGYEKIPSEAKVYVEAYRKPFWQRFQYGTYRDIKKPKEGTELTKIYSENPSFRIKIVKSEKDGREKVCASATNIFASNNINKNSFVSLASRDLKEQIWQLETGNANTVYLNNRIKNWKEFLNRTDRYSLIFPQILRQILFKYIIIDGHNLMEEEEEGSHHYTVLQKFIENIYKKNNHPFEVPDSEQSNDLCIEFIDKTVELFCKGHNLATKMLNHLERENK